MKAIVIATKEEVDLMYGHTRHSDGTEENYYTLSYAPFTRYNKDEVEFIKDINIDNPWTEITQNNCDEVYNMYYNGVPIHFAYKCPDGHIFYGSRDSFSCSFGTMAKYGGYYYMVLPKLK